MRLKISNLSAAIALLAAASVAAKDVTLTERYSRDLPLEVGGSLWIDNPVGNIEVTGTDGSGLAVQVTKLASGPDRAAAQEGLDQTAVSFEGDRNVRLIRTILPPVQTRWASSVTFIIRVPRTIHVRVAAKLAESIKVSNISGNVTVKSFEGAILLDGVTGASIIDTTNGKVSYVYRQKPSAHAQIQAVSADIVLNVPADSNFDWVADTLKGDVETNLPVRAQLQGRSFRGTVNAPGGPTIAMQTLLGSIHMMGNGVTQRARSLWENVAQQKVMQPKSQPLLMRPAKRFQLPIAGGAFEFAASFADVEVGEIRGPAHVETQAGAIKLGLVYGDCSVISHGGPLDLGDIMGTLYASTEAGDVLVRSVREGARIWTAGGLIRILYAGGPAILKSGGGDIMVRQAAGPVSAEILRSGDISITADPSQKTQKIDAHTARGNIAINLSPKFGADVDATIVTADEEENAIHSDFPGLQIKKDQVGAKTRIHATGKINGGGERLELYAEDGDIRISNLTATPVTILPPL